MHLDVDTETASTAYSVAFELYQSVPLSERKTLVRTEIKMQLKLLKLLCRFLISSTFFKCAPVAQQVLLIRSEIHQQGLYNAARRGVRKLTVNNAKPFAQNISACLSLLIFTPFSHLKAVKRGFLPGGAANTESANFLED